MAWVRESATAECCLVSKMIDWNRSHDWEVRKSFQTRYRVRVCFEGALPTAAELVAVRRCLPQSRNLPPAEFRRTIAQSGGLELEELGEIEFQSLKQRLEAEKVRYRVDRESCTSYLCVDRTTSTALLIEDCEESRRVAEEMIAMGFAVVPVEVD